MNDERQFLLHSSLDGGISKGGSICLSVCLSVHPSVYHTRKHCVDMIVLCPRA